MHTITARLLAALLLTLALAACGKGQPAASSLPSAADLVTAVAAATESLSSTHFSLTHQEGRTSMGGLLMMDSAEGDILFPSSVKATFSGAVPAFNTAVKLDLVQVGPQAAITDPFSGRWRPLDAAALPFQFTDLDKTLAAAFRALERPTVALGRPENSVATYTITGEIITDVLASLLPAVVMGQRARIDLIVGQDDKLPHLIRIHGPLLADDLPAVVRLLRLSAFNQPVTVQFPPTS